LGASPNVPASGIFLATGSAQRAPRRAVLALTAPQGHGIDELALAGGSRGPTVAWTESWSDSAGNYHSEAVVSDLTGSVRPRTFEVPGELASGLVLASNAHGDQVLVWKTCDALGSCSVRALSRATGHRFGAPARLGAIDVSQVPSAAVAPNGEALVAWITGGHVVVEDRRSAFSGFGPPTTVASTTSGSDPAVAFGPGGQALAAWTQGMAAPTLMAAFHP
jgi:hypothetical protein